jgi:lipopolysaccharide biosynthesis glycosyltransferase
VPDEAVAGFPTAGFTRKATWYRILLPDLLPQVDKLLYLDVDTIVRADVGPLWATDLGDHYVGAVTNVFQWDHVHRPAELGLEPNEYFNAGVLLMNLAGMRRDGMSRALIDFAKANADRLSWRDQDTLNLVLAKRRLPLHPRWNLMNSVLLFRSAVEVFGAESVKEARENPGIRHFEGQGVNKPWHVECDHADRQLYAELRRATPWPKVKLEGHRVRDRASRLGIRLRALVLDRVLSARRVLGRVRRRLRL